MAGSRTEARRSAPFRPSVQPLPVRHGQRGAHEHDPTLFIGETQHQAFRDKLADLFGGEIDHSGNLYPDDGFRCVVRRDLGG